MKPAKAKTPNQTSNKKSTLSIIRDLTKKELTLGGFNFKQIHNDSYLCTACNQRLNFGMIPAHTKNHQKPNKKTPQKSIQNFTEILEYEDPNKGLVYVNADNKPSKNKKPKASERRQIEHENDEYYSENSKSEASEGSSDQFSEAPPDSENSSGENSPKIKIEENSKQASIEKFRKHFNLSDSDSLTSSSGDSTINPVGDTIDRERFVDFYKCGCGSNFHNYRKFKTHCSMKKSTCERCGQVSFCRGDMKKHYAICITKELGQIKWGQKSMVPHPRYLRGIEERIRKNYAVMKEGYELIKFQEDEKQEAEEFTWLPRHRRYKYT